MSFKFLPKMLVSLLEFDRPEDGIRENQNDERLHSGTMTPEQSLIVGVYEGVDF